MCSFETLYAAYLEARKRKRSKPGTAQYEANVLACTEKLSTILSTKTYVPSRFEVFYGRMIRRWSVFIYSIFNIRVSE